MVSRNSSHTTLLKALVVGFVTTLANVAARELDSTEDVFDECLEWMAVHLDDPTNLTHASFMYYSHRVFGNQCLFDIKRPSGKKRGKNYEALCNLLSDILSDRQEEELEPSTSLSIQEKEAISDALCEIYELPQEHCDRWRVRRLDKKEAATELKRPLRNFIFNSKNTVDMTELHKVLDLADWIGYLIYRKDAEVGVFFVIDQKLGLPLKLFLRTHGLPLCEQSVVAIRNIDNEARGLQLGEAIRKAFVRRKYSPSYINGLWSGEPIINDDERRLVPAFCERYGIPLAAHELDLWEVKLLSTEQIGIYFSETIHELCQQLTVRNEDTTAVRGTGTIEDDQTAEGSPTAISTAPSHRSCVIS